VERCGIMDKGGDGNEIQDLLYNTIHGRLKANGKMSKIESEVRAMVLNEIRAGDKSSMNSTPESEKSPTQIASRLISEYLEWMNFQYTKELFEKESGVGGGSSRSIVDAQLKNKKSEFDGEVPILLTLALKLMKE
jgi:hypothetical protein